MQGVAEYRYNNTVYMALPDLLVLLVRTNSRHERAPEFGSWFGTLSALLCRQRQHNLFRLRLFVLSLTMHAKRRVFLRRVIAMSPCRLTYIYIFKEPILRFELSDNVTSRQHAARQLAVWRASLATGRQDDSEITRGLALCRTVGSDNMSTKVFLISHHTWELPPTYRKIGHRMCFSCHAEAVKCRPPTFIHSQRLYVYPLKILSAALLLRVHVCGSF
jgi:hypothetical protein